MKRHYMFVVENSETCSKIQEDSGLNGSQSKHVQELVEQLPPALTPGHYQVSVGHQWRNVVIECGLHEPIVLLQHSSDVTRPFRHVPSQTPCKSNVWIRIHKQLHIHYLESEMKRKKKIVIEGTSDLPTGGNGKENVSELIFKVPWAVPSDKSLKCLQIWWHWRRTLCSEIMQISKDCKWQWGWEMGTWGKKATRTLCLSRACNVKLYMGTSTLLPSFNLRRVSMSKSKSNASGWSKL